MNRKEYQQKNKDSVKVEKIVNITEPPSVKRARTSVNFK